MNRRRPWFPADWSGWHFPDPDHQSSLDFPWRKTIRRPLPCPMCGAPPHARCVTKTGRLAPEHYARPNATGQETM